MHLPSAVPGISEDRLLSHEDIFAFMDMLVLSISLGLRRQRTAADRNIAGEIYVHFLWRDLLTFMSRSTYILLWRDLRTFLMAKSTYISYGEITYISYDEIYIHFLWRDLHTFLMARSFLMARFTCISYGEIYVHFL